MFAGRSVAAVMLLAWMFTLGGCSVARAATMTGRAWCDVPVMPGARSVERKVDPFVSPWGGEPSLWVTMRVSQSKEETEAWYREELTKRGWNIPGSAAVHVSVATRDQGWAHEEFRLQVDPTEDGTFVSVVIVVDDMWAPAGRDAEWFLGGVTMDTPGVLAVFPLVIWLPAGYVF